MTEHVERRYEHGGPGRSEQPRRLPAWIRVTIVVSVGAACAQSVRAQSEEPPAASAPAVEGGLSSEEPEESSGEPPPLADDGAASAEEAGAITDDAPWNQGVDVAQRRAAREVFLQGNELARKRFFASAAAKYRRAIELWPHPAFSYNLALAQLQLDQTIEAHASLERAVEHGPEPLGDRYGQARQQIARIESELGAIEVICDEPGARVMLDGKLVFTGPGTYRSVVRPGAHQLVAIRRGLAPVVEQLVVSPGEQGSVALVFEYPETVVTVKRRRWAAWGPYTVVATGAALVLAGGVLDWHSSRVFDEYDRLFRARCAGGCMSDIERDGLDAKRAQGEREQRMAMIGYAVGGAALATGVVLSYLGRERTHYERVRLAPDAESAPRSSTHASNVAPLVAPGVVGVTAGFRF